MIIAEILIFIGIVVLGIFVYTKNYKQTKELDELNRKKKKLNETLATLKIQQDIAEGNINKLEDLYEQKHNDYNSLSSQYNAINAECEKLKNKLNDLIFKVQQNKEKVEQQDQENKKHFELAFEQAKDEYLNILADLKTNFQKESEEEIKARESIAASLKREKEIYDSIIAIKKHDLEEEQKSLYYTLNLTEEQKQEIQALNEIALKISAPSALYKAIYKIYYENPTNELIGRVVGSGRHIGIYKITNIDNGRSYVGQSNDLAARFKQHIKRGCGAETPTKSKLYPAMLKEGLWKFTFEVIEECTEKELNEREDYYQNFYDSINYGYSIK